MKATVQDMEIERSLSEFEEAIQKRNYVRAVKIAESIGKPSGEIRKLQQETLKQFIVDYRNPRGAIALAEEYLFNGEEVDQLLKGILQEAEEKKIQDKSQYDIKTNRYLTLPEWIREYFKR